MTPDRRRFWLVRMAWAPVVRALAVALPFALTLVVATPADGDGTRPAIPVARSAPLAKASHPAHLAPRIPQAPPLMAAGQSFVGTPAVGALFVSNGSTALGSHFCSASVVDSTSGNLVLTAAHCLNGLTASQLSFVPGYHAGHAPYGIWPVRTMITDRRWAASSDPDDDFAFLEVSPPATGPGGPGGPGGAWGARVQDITGGEFLGSGQPASGPVTVIGYPSSGDTPIFCRNQALPFGGGQLQFDCAGYAEGTSGSPLLTDVDPATGLGTVIGVIGGYQQGGSTSDVSYAARFGGAVAALLQTAAGPSAWTVLAGGGGLSPGLRPVAG